ncbi:mitochondrial amidoxime-reducing component 1 isoform X2 [Dendrobium catenatum]|uniref:mitochondrial amidoxime-reducing component 1 isoform X2 n=1 Tax=Dendrobium catenatum TaxID=906689 RepID=UPI0009F4AB8F|nr:mitochondrial amidoxime-reducing component 1 isoform X2 [Dendrobium catenatum]
MDKLFSLFSTSTGRSSSAPAATVTSIFIYPIKSCRGISVPQAPITSTGFRWDRQWMVVNSNGRALTQRVEPKLALVEPELPPDALDVNWMPSDSSYMALESRFVDPDYAQGYTAMFSDGFPYLVISQGSLDLLNELLKEPLPINRFRPNILVDGCAPFSEDLWKVTKLNNIAFHGVKLCSRCKVPTINQESGIAGTEPTETLMKFRTDKALKREKINKAKVYFGMNFVCAESLSASTMKGKVVKIGDPIHVLQRYASHADAAA